MTEVTKGAFAAMRGVTPGRVSQWISESKLHGAAIVGEGPRAKINVEAATIQLGALDQIQVAAQQTVRPQGELPPLTDDQRRITAAKAEQAEIALRASKRQELEQHGVYCRTEDAARAWGRELTELVAGIDTWLPDLAQALAGGLGVDKKLATAVLRTEWRAFRQKRSDLAKSAAAEMPPLVNDNAG